MKRANFHSLSFAVVGLLFTSPVGDLTQNLFGALSDQPIIFDQTGAQLTSTALQFEEKTQRALRKTTIDKTLNEARADLESKIKLAYVTSLVQTRSQKATDSGKIAKTIVRECETYKVDPLLVTAVISAESSFNRRAESIQGAVGLMQLLPSTARYISTKRSLAWDGENKLIDPHYNIKLGVSYLSYLLHKFSGNTEHALIAYNWGPGNLINALKSQTRIPTGPKLYAQQVMKNRSKLHLEHSTILAEQQIDPELTSRLAIG